MVLTLLLCGQLSWAAPYISGRDLYQKFGRAFARDPRLREVGQYFSVPIDHEHPESGTTEVYVRFANVKGESFNPRRPTLFVFMGGPGQHAHVPFDGFTYPGVNTLMMDQRGVGFSKAARRKLQKSVSFYSSENIARDFEVIRQALKIPKVTVLAFSYGTMPGTIYASRFPDSVTASVFWGTIFDSDLGVQLRSLVSSRFFQKAYDDLPRPLKRVVQEMSLADSTAWFPDLVDQPMEGIFGIAKTRREIEPGAYLANRDLKVRPRYVRRAEFVAGKT